MRDCPGGSSLEEKNEVMCKYKYDMIVDSPNSSFWQAVYDCAQEWAQKNDAILELRGSGRESDYSKLDYMNMSIASKFRWDYPAVQWGTGPGREDK